MSNKITESIREAMKLEARYRWREVGEKLSEVECIEILKFWLRNKTP